MKDQDRLVIRNLKAEDSKEAEAVWQVAESAYIGGSPWTVEQFRQSILAANSSFIVASLADGEIVGLLIASQTLVEADVYLVAVAKTQQQKGVGEKMFKELIKQSVEKNLETIFLEVRESNRAAYQLYSKIGFQEIGRRKNYYSEPVEDALMMKHDLRKEQ